MTAIRLTLFLYALHNNYQNKYCNWNVEQKCKEWVQMNTGISAYPKTSKCKLTEKGKVRQIH